MEARGMDAGYLLNKLGEGLDANRSVSIISMEKGGKERLANGKTIDFVDVPDYATRHRYLETAGKWYEVVDEKPEDNRPNQQLNIFMGNDEAFPERLAQLLGGLKSGSGDLEAQGDEPGATPGSGVSSNP
jgi:hypothetical protein